MKIAFTLEVNGKQQLVSTFDDATKAALRLRTALEAAPKGSAERKAINTQLKAMEQLQISTAKEATKQGIAVSKSTKLQATSLRGLNAQLRLLETQYEGFTRAERRSPLGVATARSIRSLKGEIGDIKAGISSTFPLFAKFGRIFGSLGSALTGGFFAIGASRIIAGTARELREAVDTAADFERQISFIGQVADGAFKVIETGADKGKRGIDALRESALELGGTTEFTASQVAQLEIEYSKLGFTAQQTLGFLKATIDTATVSQEPLGRTAAVIGKTIRAFGFDTSSLQASQESATRVANVLAKAFASSALDLSKFETALQQVGAVASATDQSLEDITAQLGILINNGFDASIASTSLRNIFIENAALGKTLAKSLEEVANAESSLTKANELFGKRGAPAAVILSLQQEAAEALAKTLKDTADKAKFVTEAAEAIRSDLKGAFEAATSAAERLEITFVSTFGDALNSVTRLTAGIITMVSQLITGDKALNSTLEALLGTREVGTEKTGTISVGLGFSPEAISRIIAGIEAIRNGARNLAGAFTPFIRGIQGVGRFIADFIGIVLTLVQNLLLLDGVFTAVFGVFKVGIQILGGAFELTVAFANGVLALVGGLLKLKPVLAAINGILAAMTVRLIASTASMIAARVATLAMGLTSLLFSTNILKAVTSLTSFRKAMTALTLVTKRNPLTILLTVAVALLTVFGKLNTVLGRIAGTITGIGAAAAQLGRGLRELTDGLLSDTGLAEDFFATFGQKIRAAFDEGFESGVKTFEEIDIESILNGSKFAEDIDTVGDDTEARVKKLFERLGKAVQDGENLNIAELKNLRKAFKDLIENGSLEGLDILKKQVVGSQKLINDLLGQSLGVTINSLTKRKKQILDALGDLDLDSDKAQAFIAELKKINIQLAIFEDKVSGKIIGRFEAWNKELGLIADSIKLHIALGIPYNDQLDRYLELAGKINKANKIFATDVQALADMMGLAQGSTELLTAQISLLETQLAAEGDPKIIATLAEKIATAKKQLEELNKAIERTQNPILNPGTTTTLEADIKDQIDSLNKVRETSLMDLALFEKDEERLGELRKRVNLQVDTEILKTRLKLFQKGSVQRLEIERQIAENIRELNESSADLQLNDRFRELDAILYAEIDAARERFSNNEKFLARTAVLELENTKKKLKAELEAEKDNAEARAAILIELAELEEKLSKAKKVDKNLNGPLSFVPDEDLQAVIDNTLNVLSSFGDLAAAITDARLAKEEAAIEERYKRELQLAQGNTELIARAEENKERRLEKVRKDAAKKQQKTALALAAIDGARAVLVALLEKSTAARFIALATALVTTAAQIATIKAQSFHKGGYTGRGERKDGTGHRVAGVVHGNEYVIPAKVLRTPEGSKLASRAETLRGKHGYVRGYSAPRGFVDGGLTTPFIIPGAAGDSNLQQQASGKVTARFSEDDILTMAEIVGLRVKQGFMEGISEDREENNANQSLSNVIN
jgi:hypothetical protein